MVLKEINPKVHTNFDIPRLIKVYPLKLYNTTSKTYFIYNLILNRNMQIYIESFSIDIPFFYLLSNPDYIYIFIFFIYIYFCPLLFI